MNQALLSSQNDCWETPPDLFATLDEVYEFDIDVCATPENAKCQRYFTPEQDGLAQGWEGQTCWMNPPYGRQIKAWVKKAYTESLKGALVVGLLPARTDTSWYHDYIKGKAVTTFLRGRFKFVGARHNAPFPSMIAVWHPKEDCEIGLHPALVNLERDRAELENQ